MEKITFENGSMTAAMEPDFNLLGIFQEHFKRYLRYREEPPGDAEILKVSFQFLRGSQDRQLGEIVGLVGSQDLPEVALAGSVTPITSRNRVIAFSPSSTITIAGPELIKCVRLSKNGLPR